MCVTVSSGGKKVAQPQHLLDDLVGAQVPLDPFEPAGTKDTAHPAADLSAQADRAARSLGHQDALDPPAVAALQNQLVGAVGCDIMIGDPGAEDHPLGIELLPQRLGQVRHRLERLGRGPDDPVEHLPCTVGRIAPLDHPAAPLFRRGRQDRRLLAPARGPAKTVRY